MAATRGNDTMQVVKSYFGTMPDGRWYFLQSLALNRYGATIISVRTPDKHGTPQEISLQHPTLESIREKSRYFGSTVGRVANRTREGRFQLNNQEYTLAVNNGPNHLHGGLEGYDKRLWAWRVVWEDSCAGVEFSYTSEDGEEGYPGRVTNKVTYTLSEDNRLVVEFKATTTAATPVNIVNHTYWNLSGDFARDIHGQTMQMSCSRYVPVDETQIPTGELRAVEGSAYDFRTTTAIGDALAQLSDGVDHCFVVDEDSSRAPSGRKHIATACDPISGRTLTVLGTQPGVQLYTGNFLSADSNDFPYTKHNAFCLETEHFPDSMNQPSFPSIVLQPNEEYNHTAEYIFGVHA